MKAAREHRVPLSPRVVAILRRLEKVKAGEFVFPGQSRNKPLSNKAMGMVLLRMKVGDATIHGFRSSFRDWAGNVSSFPREITETALAHVIGDKAEQAYRRSDALEKRRKLMDAWSAYCGIGLGETGLGSKVRRCLVSLSAKDGNARRHYQPEAPLKLCGMSGVFSGRRYLSGLAWS